MRMPLSFPRILIAAAPLLLATAGEATDVDGPNDCMRFLNDRGDAPEGFDAYPRVPGRFPTCTFMFGPGTQDIVCPPISTVPGPTGFVLHTNVNPGIGYWFGCPLVGMPPLGIDSEPDGKSSPAGAAMSFCAAIPVDCVEPTVFGPFGQDECVGDDDSGLAALPTFFACNRSSVTFDTWNCGPARSVFLNVLVDMNGDGDWNDNFKCGTECSYEWALKNIPISLPSGCSTTSSPTFLLGPTPGSGWMRISISDNAASDDFPWSGSATLAGGAMIRGETEDYLVEIKPADPCQTGYLDFGDAPEGLAAYPSGLVGNFPTCVSPGPVATSTVDPACPSPPVIPGPAGYVEHAQGLGLPVAFWLGCTPITTAFVDSEIDGKVNSSPIPGDPSSCDLTVLSDCVSGAPFPATFPFGQDECFADGVDAGLVTTPVFDRCDSAPIRVRMYNCSGTAVTAFVNILVDWNEDGDWTDVENCLHVSACAPEWALVNVPVVLPPGCSTWTSPPIQAGPNEGFGWMRITLSELPALPDFAWNGSASLPGSAFFAGETEDYPVVIQPSAVGVNEIQTPETGLWLGRISPNPTSTQAAVEFGLSTVGEAKVTVYDVTGKRVRALAHGVRNSGRHVISWDLRNDSGEEVSPGIYLVRLEAEGRTLTSRVTRVR